MEYKGQWLDKLNADLFHATCPTLVHGSKVFINCYVPSEKARKDYPFTSVRFSQCYHCNNESVMVFVFENLTQICPVCLHKTFMSDKGWDVTEENEMLGDLETLDEINRFNDLSPKQQRRYLSQYDAYERFYMGV